MKVDQSTISERVAALPWGDVERNFLGEPNAAWSTAGRINELLKLSAELDASDEEKIVFPLGSLNVSYAPTWSQEGVLPEHDDPRVELCREALAEGKVIHVSHEGIPIKKKNGERLSGSFRLVLKKVSEDDDAEAHFYRGQISLPHNLKRDVGASGIASLLIVEGDGPLGELLRSSEGAAHMKWVTTEPSLEENYHWGPSTIRFLNNAVKAVMEVIRREETDEVDFLNDLFGLKSVRIGCGDDEDPPPPPPPIDRLFDFNPRIGEWEHGYTIKPRSDSPDLTGRRFIVRVGYNRPHRSPLIPERSSDPRVINIEGGYHAVSGASVSEVVAEDGIICPDRFLMTIDEENFEVEIEGLDLQLKAKAIATSFEEGDY